MKISPTSKKQQNIITETIKKFRTVRQSEPNFISTQILNDVEKIKDSHKNRFHKFQRLPRLSQADLPTVNNFLSPDFKIEDNKKSPKCTFFSPPSILQQKMMKKSHNNVYFQGQISSPKNYTTKMSSTTQMKTRKSPIKNHKESLHLIQQMLMNHGIKLNSKPEKKHKQPRFSQPLLQENDGLYFGKKKQNQSLGNTKKEAPQKGDLKETMSTQASYKNMKLIKLTDLELGRDLGKGKFGRVKVAKHKKTGMLFSLKIIKKSQIRQENIVNQLIKQIKIQSFINHSHIVKLYSVFDDRQNVYLLLELCTEGNLYQLMQKKIKIHQDQASSIIREVCEGVNELHQSNIIHRDIKPQNIVLCYGMAKICDFGWSTQVKQNMRQTFCGTPLYVSPQLLSGNLYDQKIDMWSIGILGYEMITGSIPFRIKSQKDLMKIVEKQIIFPKWMSHKAVLFLKDLLEKDPTKRKQISQILCHQFLNKSKKK